MANATLREQDLIIWRCIIMAVLIMFRAKAQRSKGAKFEVFNFLILYFNAAMLIVSYVFLDSVSLLS